MAVPVGAGIGAGLTLQALISELGDAGQATIETAGKILVVPVTIEFQNGLKVGGRRRRSRAKGKKKGELFDDRVTIKRVEVPVVVLLGISWYAGWRPDGALGALLGALLGDRPVLSAFEQFEEWTRDIAGQLADPPDWWSRMFKETYTGPPIGELKAQKKAGV